MESKITNASLGYNSNIQNNLGPLFQGEIARVVSEHKERYIVRNESGVYEAEITGQLRFTAEERSDYPIVGDWVSITEYDEGKALIHQVVYRDQVLKRQAVGKSGEAQYIASNIDVAFIVEGVNRDFNINRLERYMTLCYDANIQPVFILNKVDLVSDLELEEIKLEVENRLIGVEMLCTSVDQQIGIEQLTALIQEGKTYCFLGSSGVGKSSLINILLKDEMMTTGRIGERNDRGKHTTTYRSLFLMPSGGILIDNPGVREVGMVDSQHGLEHTFPLIQEKASQCRFSDCTHEHEKGCAVIEAVNSGEIPEDAYHNYMKLQKEQEHYESSELEKRRKGKALARMVKDAKRIKNR
ncbi:ribosome small subunit-dependent GTPase A [Flammeovirga agarivorans]|uniref:ribosome small subunit-dependent GTPase A n=1 Tax=Flammeovirga agarivorans TaxID=2726742 RepID=UPI001B3B2A29|nr:ribosome small subunit-dependent GTPase A [Flammeovirga agarivorans]